MSAADLGGRPKKQRDPHPVPLVPTKIEKGFNRIAEQYGLSEYRVILLYGMMNPKRFEEGQQYHKWYAKACVQSPAGVVRLQKFVADSKKRRESLPDFIEANPELMRAPENDVLDEFGGIRPDVAAVRLAKKEVERRNGVGVKQPDKD